MGPTAAPPTTKFDADFIEKRMREHREQQKRQAEQLTREVIDESSRRRRSLTIAE